MPRWPMAPAWHLSNSWRTPLWETAPRPESAAETTHTSPLKMNSTLDQGDDAEFTMGRAKETMKVFEIYIYIRMTGGPATILPPTRSSRPRGSPHAGFDVWVPFAKKNLKALKLRTQAMLQDGSLSRGTFHPPKPHSLSQQLSGVWLPC